MKYMKESGMKKGIDKIQFKRGIARKRKKRLKKHQRRQR